MYFNLKYYVNQYLESLKDLPIDYGPFPSPLLYSGGNRDIKNMPHFAGTAILTNQDLLPDFSEATKKGDTVWLVWTNGFGGSKPETPQNWLKLDEKAYAEVRPYVGTYVYVTEYKIN
jgi:hypothetical protein